MMTLVSVLELDETARVTLMGRSGSGSVYWAVFEDANGQRAFVCIDLRKDSPTRNRLFERARHPYDPGAVLIELGSDEEAIAIPLISRWLDSDLPRSGKVKYGEEGLELIKNAFLRLGEPIVDSNTRHKD